MKFVPTGFPRGPDPGKLLLGKGWKVKIRQLPGSSLPPEVLKLGFNAMNSRRSLWLNDIKSGLFILEKIAEDDLISDHEEEATIVGVQNTLLDDNLEAAVEHGSQLELGSEEEWNGIGEDEFDEYDT